MDQITCTRCENLVWPDELVYDSQTGVPICRPCSRGRPIQKTHEPIALVIGYLAACIPFVVRLASSRPLLPDHTVLPTSPDGAALLGSIIALLCVPHSIAGGWRRRRRENTYWRKRWQLDFALLLFPIAMFQLFRGVGWT